MSHIARKLRWLPIVNLPVAFPLTVRHYYSFSDVLNNSDLASKESWDVLRKAHPHFVVPDDRATWLAGLHENKDGQDAAVEKRAADICGLLIEHGMTTVHSVGVGGAALEYFLKRRCPDIRMTVSDFNPEGVARLRRVFTEAAVECFDVTSPNWPATDCVMINRVDPHLDDEQWRAVFRNLARSGIRNVLYIPSHEISFQYLAFALARMLFWQMRGRHVSFAGYVRSGAAFPSLWQDCYNHVPVTLGYSNSYWLTLR